MRCPKVDRDIRRNVPSKFIEPSMDPPCGVDGRKIVLTYGTYFGYLGHLLSELNRKTFK